MVLRVCRRVLGNRHDAEDAFQATFLVLARKTATVRPPDALAAWLHGVACRVALAARTGAARHPLREAPDLAPADRRPDPLSELTAREALEILDEEVRRLPMTYRLPVILCCLEGLSQEEAARQLGCSPGAVKGRLERGRARLRERLTRRGLTLPVALAAAGIDQRASMGLAASLAEATVRSAVAFVAGGAPASVIPARVAMLADGGLKGRAATKKVGAALALMTGALIATAGVALRQDAPMNSSGGDPRAKGLPGRLPPARLDAHGDPLPSGAVSRLGTLRFRHRAPVNGVAYSPDGKLLATGGSHDYQVRLWEAATGRLLASVPGARAVVFTHKGQGLYYCANSEAGEGKLLSIPQLREEETPISAPHSTCLALSPDGHSLAADYWKDVLVRDLTTGQVRHRLTGHRKSVSCVAYSPDGKMIATAGDEEAIQLWDATTGRLLRRLEGHKARDRYSVQMVTFAFSPDGRQLLSGGYDHTARLWDVATGREVGRLGEHKGGVLCVAYTPSGKQVFTGGFEEPIRLWDVATGKEVRRFPKRSEGAFRMALAPGCQTIASSHVVYRAPRFWDVAGGREILSSRGPEVEVTGIVFSRDARTLTTARHDGISQWEADTGRELCRWEKVPSMLSCLTSSPDGRIVAGGNIDGTICLWQADTGRELRRLEDPKGWVLGLAFAPDGKVLASACNDGVVRLWDLATGAQFRRLTGHTRYARDVAFSPDGKTLASAAEDQSVRLWRIDTGEEMRRLETSHLQTQAVAISPDGLLLAAASPGGRPIQVWELASGRELPQFAPLPSPMWIYSAVFSPDGRTLATGGEDGVVRLWEVPSGQERRRFTGHTGWVYRVRFAPDGKRLASASNDTTAVV
jgi:RNA polymerase sigma factor (sigma-70 family)